MDQVVLREIEAKDAEQVNALVSAAFGYSAPHTFFDDFPIWGSNEVTRLGWFEKDQLLSHVGIRFTQMKLAPESIPVALIGGVATRVESRGRGLSTRLMTEALKRVDERGCKWSILWGSEHEFYQKLGFQLRGDQSRAAVSSLAVSPRDLSAQRIETGFTSRIFDFLVNRKSGIELTRTDLSWFQRHHTVEWFYLDHPFAFVAYQRGLDLPHLIHEIGGDPAQIQRLLFQVFQKDPLLQVLGASEDLKTLGFLESDLIHESLCLARPHEPGLIWNPKAFISGLSAC